VIKWYTENIVEKLYFACACDSATEFPDFVFNFMV